MTFIQVLKMLSRTWNNNVGSGTESRREMKLWVFLSFRLQVENKNCVLLFLSQWHSTTGVRWMHLIRAYPRKNDGVTSDKLLHQLWHGSHPAERNHYCSHIRFRCAEFHNHFQFHFGKWEFWCEPRWLKERENQAVLKLFMILKLSLFSPFTWVSFLGLHAAAPAAFFRSLERFAMGIKQL